MQHYVKAWLDTIDGKEKFVLVVGTGITNTVLLILHYIDASSFVNLTSITIGAYMVAHAGEAVGMRFGGDNADPKH